MVWTARANEDLKTIGLVLSVLFAYNSLPMKSRIP